VSKNADVHPENPRKLGNGSGHHKEKRRELMRQSNQAQFATTTNKERR
jgi:hypothetical protein